MPSHPRAGNRGPAAAAANRQALLAAARSLFAARGYHVPLSAVAKQAGVGQGVLYRHFPTRLALALAVFEENFAELDALAAGDEPGAFDRMWRRLVELTLDSFGFVEMVVHERDELTTYDGDAHLARVLAPVLARAWADGSVRPEVGVQDVALGLRMVYGVAATSPDPALTRDAVSQAESMLRAHWSPA